jgi:tetratricopeptide (TPR) repeat protein
LREVLLLQGNLTQFFTQFSFLPDRLTLKIFRMSHVTNSTGERAAGFVAIRFLFAAIIILFCSFAMRSSWRAGVGRLLARDASRVQTAPNVQRDQANRAVELSPQDPETHSVRALAYYRSNDLKTTIDELQQGVTLRPRDYLLWLQLGRARDEEGDVQGAKLAMQQATALAPYYSDPRWQYGNVLYRAGETDEAFRELRRAAEAEPSLFPVLMDLAWGTYRDAATVERIIAPRTDALRLSLARFFVKRGLTNEALALFRAAGGNAVEEKKQLLNELIKNKQFKTAYEVWKTDHAGADASNADAVINSGFEDRISLLDKSFGWWQEKRQERVSLSLDTKAAHSGASSLFVEWSGDSPAGSAVLSQLVLTQPATRYRLSFFARTENIVTASLPVITITDASGKDARLLGQSQTLPQGTTPWNQYDAVFDTTASTEAVLLSIQRQSCSPGPCPIFGMAWFDDFSLRKE